MVTEATRLRIMREMASKGGKANTKAQADARKANAAKARAARKPADNTLTRAQAIIDDAARKSSSARVNGGR